MAESQLDTIAPAFARYLKQFRRCFTHENNYGHFDHYCQGLIAQLPRKTVEPIALAAGTAVRTLQEFLVTNHWDHDAVRDQLHRHIKRQLRRMPDAPLGTIGLIDETSCLKKGDKTPGVQRQYLGCAGKVDNGIVTVHFGVTRGDFQALLESDLFLPQSWAEDRERCEKAGIPASKRHRVKWKLAFEQLTRLNEKGIHFDWLTFDEGYGNTPAFLYLLSVIGQKFVAEVPKSMSLRLTLEGPAQRADTLASTLGRGRDYRFKRRTTTDTRWRVQRTSVWLRGRAYVLLVARNRDTDETKYFLSNGVGESIQTMMQVAFRRAAVEQSFRLAKQEAGLMHYEGRQYVGLMRHLLMALVVLGFVTSQTALLRKKK